MIIVGAGSAGKEIMGVYTLGKPPKEIVFYDDNPNCTNLIDNKYTVIKTLNELQIAINKSPEFCIGIGNPRKRKKLYAKLVSLGGKPKNISWEPLLSLSSIEDNGSVFQPGVVISFDVTIGKSCFIHANSSIGHKVNIGDFVNISPLCSVIGPSIIGSETYIGAGSTILPDIKIGKNVFISPGSIVNRDLADFETF